MDKLQVLAIVPEGVEDIAKQEAEEMLGVDVSCERGFILFSISHLKDALRFAYFAHTVIRVMLLADKIAVNNPMELSQILKNSKPVMPFPIQTGLKFAARSYNPDTKAIEEALGGYIHKELKLEVDLGNPDVIFLSFLDGNNLYYGIDVAGIDLSKREYKVFLNSSALKATIAFSLLKIGGWSMKKILLDPFCGSGEIAIEAALYKSGISPHHFNKSKFLLSRLLNVDMAEFDRKTDGGKEAIFALDKKFSSVSSAKKNAKIANVVNHVKFSRLDMSWLDTKFDKKTVDILVTNPPRISKFSDKKAIMKVYKELFYQAEFVLKDDGKIVILTTNKDEFLGYASEYKFKLIHERKVYSGKQQLDVMVFSK